MQCTGLAVLLLCTLVHWGRAALHHKDVSVAKGKICIGTSGSMSVPANRDHHYQNLRDRYINCTNVDGNLEITWLLDHNLDLSFLKEIREVTGYVLITHVNIRRIVLPNLMIIRGRNLFKLNPREEEFALLVAKNTMEILELPALRDILSGGVGFFDNNNLCYMNTIKWEEIINGYVAKPMTIQNSTVPESCPPCDKNCVHGCWGPGPHSCQKFSKINCSPQCHQGRCFGPNPRECCHLFCAGGCSGPTQSDCLACKNFDDNGVCKQECPPMRRYNPATYSWESNPEGKYAYGATCVKNCPEHLLRDSGACVRSCPDTKKAVDGECVPCDGPCPKNCQGVNIVHAGNIHTFKGCTVIEGSLTILDSTFEGFQDIYPNFTFGPRYSKMHPNELEVFSTLREVTGFVNIQANHSDFKNLSYFRNLEIIDGRQLTELTAALYIVKTSLESLNLRSLRKVRSGSVAVVENPKLCFASEIEWKQLMRSNTGSVYLESNAGKDKCRKQGLICHEQCSSDGCWGLGPDECLSCKSYRLKETCIPGCNATSGIYDAGGMICELCDEECLGECLGPGPSNCTQCRNARDGPYCVSQCPLSKYNENRECMSCHENCANGCTGPRNTVGPGGCNSCDKAIVSAYDPNIVEQCLKAEEPCPDGFYQEYSGSHEEGIMKSLSGKTVCRKCHHRCKNCTAYGIHISVCDCLKFHAGEQCEDSCPRDHYADNTNFHCFKCAEECRGCFGPSSTECNACRNYRVYLSANRTVFNCTASCPAEKPYKVFDDNMEDPFCSDMDPIALAYHGIDDDIPAILGGVVGCIALLAVFLGVFGYQWIQRVKTKENTMMMTMRMTGFEDNEPLKPTNVKPNLAKLRIVKEADLRKGGILGYGAFGTVYKGVWVPEGENVKIPVAIKVLRDGTCPNNNKEILEEAYFMASVDHPNLLKLLAVCMASQLMLVTQLMPLGCLLDYVRSNKDKIGSKPLLSWCSQIARGMAYLEERRMVHRDLALRNVLLQTPGCIKITDFGLAKFLDINEEEYKAEGGKMPIKWLALECIQHRIFTHKSDVWAFGVTVWELLTYGGRPYENTPAREVPDLLEKGERLPQPSICTIDVYMLMIKCWMLDAESRPTFKELADQFSKMARDPGRFLVVKGDKLMQLPAFSACDVRDLIRTIGMSVDAPGVVMDAEQYLHPSLEENQKSETDSVDKNKTGSDNVHTPTQLFPNNNFPQCSELMPVPLQGNSSIWYNGDAHSDQPPVPRYCPDPLNVVGKGDMYKIEAEKYLSSHQPSLPVDEEDYLMPASCSRGPSVRYMDLIGDTHLPESVDVRPISYYHYIPDFIPVHRHAMDNLEYLMMNDNSANMQPKMPPQHFQRLPSTEEESDYVTSTKPHSSVPHHRNETTV